MAFFNSEKHNDVVHIPLADTLNIGDAARMFGARTNRAARRHPGSFERPVVGDREYFIRQATLVFRAAIKQDDKLNSLYLLAGSRSAKIEQSLRGPAYPVSGPAVEDAQTLAGETRAIVRRLGELDLKVPLEGKWRERAYDVADFAIRVIAGTGLTEEHGKLYAGLPHDKPVNQPEYWHGLLSMLETGAE